MKGVISLKKRIIPLILLLAMLLSLSAYAASPRVMTILPAISFDGTTANCRVSVSADRSTDQISAVIQLWNGSTRIARWTDSGTGYLLFSNSATVSKGKTYELMVSQSHKFQSKVLANRITITPFLGGRGIALRL